MFNQQTYEAMIQLFNNEVIVTEKNIRQSFDKTVPHGYVLFNVPYSSELHAAVMAQSLSQANANNTFLKTWERAATISTEERLLLQLTHYFSTYGLESFGIEVEPFVDGELNVTELAQTFRHFSAITPEEALDRILGLSKVALAERTLENIMVVLDAIQEYINPKYILDTTNNELLSRVCDRYGIVPQKPDQWLRYVIYKVTGETLVIKNDAMFQTIVLKWNPRFHDKYLVNAPHNLASIFLRNKPLFLAMKKASNNKAFFNRLRRQADKMHKPLSQPYFREVTDAISAGNFNVKRFQQSLETASVFDCVKVYNALAFRFFAEEKDPIVYRVRNGKSYVSNVKNLGTKGKYVVAMAHTLNAMGNKLPSMAGKKVYIPEYIEYGVPTSEKMFIGNLPNNTRISFQNPVAIGVHWMEYSVDIDLSCFNEDGRFGWNGDWRNQDNSILYSGDMTRAQKPYGASEMFRYSGDNLSPMVLSANFYNFWTGDKTDAKMFLAPVEHFKNSAIDISKALFTADFVMDREETTLGIFEVVDGVFKTYLTMQQLSERNVSAHSDKYSGLIEYTVAQTKSALSFNQVLEDVMGAEIIREMPEESDEEILDLSPKNLGKDSLLQLLKKTDT